MAWCLAFGWIAATRYRGKFGPYVSLHQWMADLGAPAWVRHLDSTLLMVIGAAAICLLLRIRARHRPGRPGDVLDELGLGGRCLTPVACALLMLLPMLLLPMFVGGWPVVRWEMMRTCAGAALGEELFFRGAMVLALVRYTRTGFWTAAIVSAVLFGAIHFSWTRAGIAAGWPNALPTGIGGVWFAWLAMRWGSPGVAGRPATGNLWVPLVLHAGMNMAWEWYAVGGGGAGGAVGGLWANIGRAGTIVMSIVVTRRNCPQTAPGRRSAPPPAQDGLASAPLAQVGDGDSC